VIRLRLCRSPLPLTRLQDRTEICLAYSQALPVAEVLTAVTIRFSDQYPSLREVDGLSDTAFRLHISAFFWIALNRTDGLIRREDLDLVCARVRASERFAAECVQRGAWHDARHDCGSEFCLGPVDADGWIVHDYLKDNPSAAELEAAESGKSQGGKRGNHKRWHADLGKKSPGCEFCEAPEGRKASPRKPPPKRTSHKRSHTDRISESHPTPRSRSDFDFDLDQSPAVNQVSQSGVVNAGAREETPAVIAAVIDAVCVKDGRVIDAAEAATACARIRARPKTPRKLRSPVKYFTTVIENEEDLYAELLDEPPPLRVILSGPPPPPPGALHEFVRNPATGACAECDMPRSNTSKHTEAKPTEARTA
jgi:hypothetical protein